MGNVTYHTMTMLAAAKARDAATQVASKRKTADPNTPGGSGTSREDPSLRTQSGPHTPLLARESPSPGDAA